jgi:hypothetical protein
MAPARFPMLRRTLPRQALEPRLLHQTLHGLHKGHRGRYSPRLQRAVEPVVSQATPRADKENSCAMAVKDVKKVVLAYSGDDLWL